MLFFVMAKTVLGSLFKLPATRRYPFGCRRPDYKNTRGRIITDINKCIFCGLCAQHCPAGAISVNKTEKKWQIERLRCLACGYCAQVCPKKCLSMDSQYSKPCLGRAPDIYQNA